jgi:glycosyltransferase involved in cell wall biosynthesis
MTRILMLIKGLGRGGAELILAAAARHFDGSRFDYEVAYLLPWKDALTDELAQAGIRTHCLYGARGARWTGRLRGLVRDRGIDLVHAHSPVAAVGARLVLRGGARRPLVYTEHNVWARYHPATRWANMITFGRNDHVFTVSDEVRRSIRYLPFQGKRRTPSVETLYHGIDLGRVARSAEADGVRAELGIPDGAPLIGTVANLKPGKGQRHLLKAAVVVRRHLPQARFVLVGVGPSEDALRREAAALGLNGSVLFTGFRQDAVRISAALDLFVLPSEYEGLPIALVEAMALGRPVVATRAGGTPEVLADGVQGRLVPPRDPSALAEAIVAVLQDEPARRRMGDAGRARSADFDIRRAVRRMEQVYAELVT